MGYIDPCYLGSLHHSPQKGLINSLDPWRCGYNFEIEIFNLVLLIGILSSSYENASGECHGTLLMISQATSHYLSQC